MNYRVTSIGPAPADKYATYSPACCRGDYVLEHGSKYLIQFLFHDRDLGRAGRCFRGCRHSEYIDPGSIDLGDYDHAIRCPVYPVAADRQ